MDKQLEQTIAECKKNNRRAQRALYDYCFPPMMAICLRYQKNREDALALVNASFLKILLHIEQYDSTKPFLTWVSSITIRTGIDLFRKQKKHKQEQSVEDVFESEEAFTDELSEQIDAEQILGLIHQLPAHEKLVFNLFEIEGYSHQEIADQLRVSERSTKRYLAGAKNRLKKWIMDLEFVFL
jgi:RNA polymerase sigma-70 factor (ECF subfamily)